MKPKERKRGPGRPATGTAPKRYFRMDDESWESVERAAKASQQTVSAFVRDALERAVKRSLRAS